MSRSLIPLLSGLLVCLPLGATQAGQEREERLFAAIPGDTVVIQNDYGRIRISPASGQQVKVTIRKIAISDDRLENVVVLAQKVSQKIFLSTFYYDYQAESVYLDIEAPPFVNVAIWGANPAVEISGIQGYVRVFTQTGLITAADLTSSVSLMTESGSIVFRSRRQPEKDIRLESIHGEVRCELAKGLNLRGWARAGGHLDWNSEVEFNDGRLERQIGVGGPLLLAASQEGAVHVRFNLKPSATVASIPEMPPPSRRKSSAGSETRSRSPGPVLDAPRDEPDPVDADNRSGPVHAPPGHSAPAGTGPDPGMGEFSIKVDVNWIYLNVSVRDRLTNRSIPDLKRDDFLVYEDSHLQQIEQFQSTDAPFSILLLLDVSGSTEDYVADVKSAATQFLRQMRSDDRIAIAIFNSSTYMVHAFTSDRGRLERQIRRIRAGGGTAFYDALDICVNDYLYGEEGRKAIVVFTDGVDGQLIGQRSSGSRITFGELYRSIEESESIIYTIFLDTQDRGGQGNNRAYERAYGQMQNIADQTGGRFYGPNSIYDIQRMFEEIADDLRVQYMLAYNSTNTNNDGAWRKLRVRIRENQDWVPRTRKGYYAPRG